MYTSHGHHIPGTNRDLTLPEYVAKCGGTHFCVVCQSEAESVLKPWPVEQEEKKILETVQASLSNPSKYKIVSVDDLIQIDRNARAYGFEIGRGKPLTKQVEPSEDNPFMDPNWANNVLDGD